MDHISVVITSPSCYYGLNCLYASERTSSCKKVPVLYGPHIHILPSVLREHKLSYIYIFCLVYDKQETWIFSTSCGCQQRQQHQEEKQIYWISSDIYLGFLFSKYCILICQSRIDVWICSCWCSIVGSTCKWARMLTNVLCYSAKESDLIKSCTS